MSNNVIKYVITTKSKIKYNQKRREHELRAIEVSIQQKEAELEQIIPSYINEVNQEAQLKEE